MPKSPTTPGDPLGEAERLRVKRRALEAALGEFLHEGRRVRDALERAGGRSRELERKAKLLARNVRLTERDLAACDKALAALEDSPD